MSDAQLDRKDERKKNMPMQMCSPVIYSRRSKCVCVSAQCHATVLGKCIYENHMLCRLHYARDHRAAHSVSSEMKSVTKIKKKRKKEKLYCLSHCGIFLWLWFRELGQTRRQWSLFSFFVMHTVML